MKKGEIPWIYNEAFEPHFFSIYDQPQESAAEPEDIPEEEDDSLSSDLKIY